MSRVRELSKSILNSSKYVCVNKTRARQVAKELENYELFIPTYNYELFYPRSNDFEDICQYFLTFNAINYCYFDQHGDKFRTKAYSGSTLATLCMTACWSELSNPLFLSNVDENYLLAELFKAGSPISLVKERTQALRELGQFLSSNVGFTFEKLFLRSRKNAYIVSQLIPTFLPSWRDPFYKRAQLFVGMVYGRLQHCTELPFIVDSLSDLTVFADYKVPQALIAMGIIELKTELLMDIHSKNILSSGSRKELELRAATVLGADALLEEIQKIRSSENINILHVDYLLWNMMRKPDNVPCALFVRAIPPHHLTITTDY